VSFPHPLSTAAGRISSSAFVTEKDLIAFTKLLGRSFLLSPRTHVKFYFLIGLLVISCTTTACCYFLRAAACEKIIETSR
jgi:hypothetical protein